MNSGTAKQRKVLAKQLAMDRQTWRELQKPGETEDSELNLDFFYICPDEQRARKLATSLELTTDYKVEAGPTPGKLPCKKDWSVTGTTGATKVSQKLLDQWGTRMTAAGFDVGCEFDGFKGGLLLQPQLSIASMLASWYRTEYSTA